MTYYQPFEHNLELEISPVVYEIKRQIEFILDGERDILHPSNKMKFYLPRECPALNCKEIFYDKFEMRKHCVNVHVQLLGSCRKIQRLRESSLGREYWDLTDLLFNIKDDPFISLRRCYNCV